MLGFVFDLVAIAHLPLAIALLLAGIWLSSLVVDEVATAQEKPTLEGLLAIVKQPPVLVFMLAGVLLQQNQRATTPPMD